MKCANWLFTSDAVRAEMLLTCGCVTLNCSDRLERHKRHTTDTLFRLLIHVRWKNDDNTCGGNSRTRLAATEDQPALATPPLTALVDQLKKDTNQMRAHGFRREGSGVLITWGTKNKINYSNLVIV